MGLDYLKQEQEQEQEKDLASTPWQIARTPELFSEALRKHT